MEPFVQLATEQRNERSDGIDRMTTAEMLRMINGEDQSVAGAVERVIPQIAAAVDAIYGCLSNGGRLFYVGAGTSGRLGVLDASECAPTFNVSPELVQGIMAGGESALSRATEASEDDPQAGARDLLSRGFAAGDVLCGIAASGRTPYVLGAVAEAKKMGAVTVGLSCVAGSALERAAGFPITPVTGPEVITGSTRLKAGTATKLVLNMITTSVMVKLGMTYGNLMVNVQPKNEKLRDRATRIVMAVTGIEYKEASEVLLAAGDDVRTAIVMQRLSLERERAEQMLRDHGKVLSRVLARDLETNG